MPKVFIFLKFKVLLIKKKDIQPNRDIENIINIHRRTNKNDG